MPSGLNRNQLLQLARLGAKARLAELEEERKAIEGLIGSAASRKAGGRRHSTVAKSSATANESTGRRTMSAAARRAVSRRMKRYWAERRKAQAKVK